MDELEKPIDFSNVKDILTRDHEDDYGELEYKYKLVDLTPEQKIRLTGQMKYRLKCDENYGQATYDIGLTDDGFGLGLKEDEMKESLDNLRQIAENADAKICAVHKHTVTHFVNSEEDLVKYVHDKRYIGKVRNESDSASQKRKETQNQKGKNKFIRHVAEVIIRQNTEQGYIDLRVGIAGNVDAGKSTLLGVLTKGALDDGRGSARMSVFNFKHEVDSGRTSSIGQQIMGFNSEGKSVVDTLKVRNPTWEDIVKSSTKIVTFFDLAGHAPYLKTTILGITSNRPDYCLILVGANMGITKSQQDMTIEHISICLSMKVPFIVIITKIDMCPPKILEQTINDISNVIKKTVRKIVYHIKNEDDVSVCSQKIKSGDIVPIFQISNVAGTGIDLVKMFLNFLPIRKSFKKVRKKEVIFQIQEVYRVTGVGAVVGGLLSSGTIHTNKLSDSKLLKLGPLSDGSFVDAYIRSVQCKKVNVEKAEAGKWITVAVPKVDRKVIKKGMYILTESIAKTTWEFKAKVFIDTKSSCNIGIGYQPHCHIGHIKQTCKITDISSIEQSSTTKKRLAKQGKHMLDNTTIELIENVIKSKSKVWDEITKKDILSSQLLFSETKELISKSTEINTKLKNILKNTVKNAVLPNLAAGDFAELKIRFCFRAEFLFEKDRKRFLFREIRTRGIGMIISLTDKVYKPMSNKKVTKDRKSSKKQRPTRKQRRERRSNEHGTEIKKTTSKTTVTNTAVTT